MKSKLQLYRDKKDQWRWRLKASNGRIVATGGESFSSRAKCNESVVKVWSTFQSDNFDMTGDGATGT
jgi:uncharacterized protein YegP (UPF0339 family)